MCILIEVQLIKLKPNTHMNEETKRLWDILKGKINTDAGLADVKIYFPELSEEIDAIIFARGQEPSSDELQ